MKYDLKYYILFDGRLNVSGRLNWNIIHSIVFKNQFDVPAVLIENEITKARIKIILYALFWSRKRESNPPGSAWEADAIPLGDTCVY